MSGNVWEWCKDWYEKGYYASSLSTNPRGPNSGTSRVLRGGSWARAAATCRVADRISHDPGDRYSDSGFRVVLSQ